MRCGASHPRCRPTAGALIVIAAFASLGSVAALAQRGSPVAPAASAANVTATPMPERDRASLIAALRNRLPGVPPEEWSQGGASFAPGVAVIPLGGSNATNLNDILAIGKKSWDRKFRNGKSLAGCFANGGQRIAATYPQVDPKSGAIITIEEAINACLRLHDETPLPLSGSLTMGAVSAYMRSLSAGHKLNIRVNGVPAATQYAAGRQWFTKRIGDQDLACASCHVLQAGQTREENGRQVGFSPAVGQVLAWPRVEPGGKVRMLHQQFQLCMDRAGAAPFDIGGVEFAQLEYFLAAVSSGLTVRAPIATH